MLRAFRFIYRIIVSCGELPSSFTSLFLFLEEAFPNELSPRAILRSPSHDFQLFTPRPPRSFYFKRIWPVVSKSFHAFPRQAFVWCENKSFLLLNRHHLPLFFVLFPVFLPVKIQTNCFLGKLTSSRYFQEQNRKKTNRKTRSGLRRSGATVNNYFPCYLIILNMHNLFLIDGTATSLENRVGHSEILWLDSVLSFLHFYQKPENKKNNFFLVGNRGANNT